jgi:energy-coupling factor transporter ATP-binding protein EcfA2
MLMTGMDSSSGLEQADKEPRVYPVRVGEADDAPVINLTIGQTTILVGANGSGKSRLAIWCEINLEKAHRVSAHRSMELDLTVPKISESQARAELLYGTHQPVANWGGGQQTKEIVRWNQKAATLLLSDYGKLLQVLFAEQANTALRTHNAAHVGNLTGRLALTYFQQLVSIWERVLPGRSLKITADDIQVEVAASQGVAGADPAAQIPLPILYSASEMSDGERAVFYMIGQVLVAEPDSVLIFDEPELHVHRAILGRLWDELEAARIDCAFLLITHDLEFAASRKAQKFVIQKYVHKNSWELEQIPADVEFSEELTTLILGSRRPILFVEGTDTSLDLPIYRACYPSFTVVPRGSCEIVVKSVTTMRKNAQLTRVTCAGIVDGDGLTEEERQVVEGFGIGVLPVSEIENIFLLPGVAQAILEMEGYSRDEIGAALDAITAQIVQLAENEGVRNSIIINYCRRRIDRSLKRVSFEDATSVEELGAAFGEKMVRIDVRAVSAEISNALQQAIDRRDVTALLIYLDAKGPLLNIAASTLKGNRARDFLNWALRIIGSKDDNALKQALTRILPNLIPG